MNNNEFASLLLTEAAELLNEASRYDKEIAKDPTKNSRIGAGQKIKKELDRYDRLYAEYNKTGNLFLKQTYKDSMDVCEEDIKRAKEKAIEIKSEQDKKLGNVKNESIDLAMLLDEAIDFLNEPNYIEKKNSLYDGTKFIGSYDNDKEKEELKKEYEEELKKEYEEGLKKKK